MTPDRRRRALFLFTSLAALSGIVAVWVMNTGGFRVRVFGIPISVRSPGRAVFLAIVFTAVACTLVEKRTWKSLLKGTRASLLRLSNSTAGLGRWSWVLPLAAAIAVMWAGIAFGTRSAGGADTYGYVSQAKLWLEGDVRVRDDRPANPPWPDSDGTFTPLGYRPAANHTLVPTYSPGLPLLMALSELIGGACGPFIVVPVCAALLVWLTYRLGARVSGDAVGVGASLCVAVSPAVLIMTMSPMSDVPASAFWTASLVLACRGDALATAAAGAAAGIAITIRPNLAPLAVFPLVLAMLQVARTGFRLAAHRAVLFLLPCAPAVLFVGWLFNALYGSPLESGYGHASLLYDFKNVPANVTRYSRWVWEIQGPVPFLFLLTPLVALRRGQDGAALRWLLFAFVAATFAAYVTYEPFEEWWYLRFMLPAFPAVFILAFDVARSIGGLIGGLAGRAVAVTIALVGLYHGAAVVYERDMLHVAEGEQKYADVGRFVAARLPAQAVLLSMQHSGTVRLYSGRLTLRYDMLDARWLDRALEYLRKQGREPYLLLEDWEVPNFKERFAGQKASATVDAEPLAVLPKRNVLLFSTDMQHEPQIVPEIIGPSSGCAVARR